MHPASGSRIEAARDFGVDLAQLVGQLRLTPAERAQQAASVGALEKVRGIARKRS